MGSAKYPTRVLIVLLISKYLSSPFTFPAKLTMDHIVTPLDGDVNMSLGLGVDASFI